jgi:hypothetical protein
VRSHAAVQEANRRLHVALTAHYSAVAARFAGQVSASPTGED